MEKLGHGESIPSQFISFFDSFVQYEQNETGEWVPVLRVDNSFIHQYIDLVRMYGRPETVAACIDRVSGDDMANLLCNRYEVLANHLARLSFELVANFARTRGAAVSTEALHYFLECMERWNVFFTETSELGVDIYFRELHESLAVFGAHLQEIGHKKEAMILRRYQWPFVFSHFS